MNDLCKIKQDLSGLVLQRLLTKIVKHNSRPFRSDGLTVFFEKKSFETSRTKKKKARKHKFTALLLHTYEWASHHLKKILTTDWTNKNEEIEQHNKNCLSVKLPLLCTVPRTLNIGNCWLCSPCALLLSSLYCYVIYNYYIHSVVLFTTKKEKAFIDLTKVYYCSICM